MADDFIDLDETQVCGPHASKMIRSRVVGLVPELDAGMKKLAADIDYAAQTVAEIAATSRDASSKVREGAKGKGLVLAEAVRAPRHPGSGHWRGPDVGGSMVHESFNSG